MKSKELPKKYKANESEAKWGEFWESKGVYKYNPEVSREDTFVIDTPPPTVSGSSANSPKASTPASANAAYA